MYNCPLDRGVKISLHSFYKGNRKLTLTRAQPLIYKKEMLTLLNNRGERLNAKTVLSD